MMSKFKVYCNSNSALLVLQQIFKLPASIATIPEVAVTFYLMIQIATGPKRNTI